MPAFEGSSRAIRRIEGAIRTVAAYDVTFRSYQKMKATMTIGSPIKPFEDSDIEPALRCPG
jgi:hypothetical protein